MSITFGTLPPQTKYITNNLIIGARQGLSGLRQLRNEEAVTQIIDLRSAKDLKKLNEFLLCKALGLRYESYPLELMNKTPLRPQILENISNSIQKNQDGRTFVHCNSGRHRSLFIAAMEEFKNGNIKTFDDFKEFLHNGDFYKLRKKVKYGIKFNLTPEDIRFRTENLNFQKDNFWEILNSRVNMDRKL